MSGTIPPTKASDMAEKMSGLLAQLQDVAGPGLDIGGMAKRLTDTEARTTLINFKLTILLEHFKIDWKNDPRIKELNKK